MKGGKNILSASLACAKKKMLLRGWFSHMILKFVDSSRAAEVGSRNIVTTIIPCTK